jgi:hypothetical protein
MHVAAAVAVAGMGLARGQACAPEPVVFTQLAYGLDQGSPLLIKATGKVWARDEADPFQCSSRPVLGLFGGNGAGPTVSVKFEPSPGPGAPSMLIPALIDGWAYIRLEKDEGGLRRATIDLNNAKQKLGDVEEQLNDEAKEGAQITRKELDLERQRAELRERIEGIEARIHSPVTIDLDSVVLSDDARAAAGAAAAPKNGGPWFPMIVVRWVRAGARGTDILVRTRTVDTVHFVDVAIITAEADASCTTSDEGLPSPIASGKYKRYQEVANGDKVSYKEIAYGPITSDLTTLRDNIFLVLNAHPDEIFPKPTDVAGGTTEPSKEAAPDREP